jgi:hypothetical protein
MPPLRKILLAVVLAATIAASLFDLPGTDAVPAEKASAAPVASAVAALPKPPIADASALPHARFESWPQQADLFVSRSWQPPPAPPPKAEAPRAPVLPFRYLGKVLEGGAVMAFVSQGALTHLLRQGDVLADYKVDAITPVEMTFVYLPLNEKQRLTFGSAN